MPRYAPTYTASGLTPHTTIGTEEEINYILKPQSMIAFEYDSTLYVSRGSVGAANFVGGGSAPKMLRMLELSLDQVHHYGKNSGKLELKTGPFLQADAIGRAATARTTFVSLVGREETLKSLVDRFNKTSFVKSNPNFELIITADCGIKSAQAGMLNIGPKDRSAATAGVTTQVNISVPFEDLGKDDPSNLLLRGSWRSPPRQKSLQLAVRAANRFVDLSQMGSGNRECKKVRSLLTLFFYNFLVFVRAADSSHSAPSSAITTVNKDNWDWLPKISIADALEHILAHSNPTQPHPPLLAKETDAQAMLRVASTPASFDPAFAEVLKLIRASLLRQDLIERDRFGAPLKGLDGKPKVKAVGKDVVMNFFRSELRNNLKKLLESDLAHWRQTNADGDRVLMLGDTKTGKPLLPTAPVPGHKASHFMVVFEIRAGGSIHQGYVVNKAG